MGVDLVIYWAAIEAVYVIAHSFVNQTKMHFNSKFNLLCTVATLALLFTRCFTHKKKEENDTFTAYRLILLLMYMDIHSNRDPHMSDSDIGTLDIFHLNTRSIRNKTEDIVTVADEYYVLCFSETHLDHRIDTAALVIEGMTCRFEEIELSMWRCNDLYIEPAVL